MTLRLKVLSALGDLPAGARGLEIGPLDSPTVLSESHEMSYVDLVPREELSAFYANDDAVDTDLIPHIDHVMRRADGSTGTLADTVTDGPYDFIVANHVLEHVPDLAGWLRETAQLLVEGGRLLLSVPDRRYTFDVLRPASTTGQVLAAHDAGDRRPGVAAVYDQNRNHCGLTPKELWDGKVPTFADRVNTLEHVVSQVEAVRAGEYVDTHVWCVTPDELAALLEDLDLLGLLPFDVDTIVPTPRPTNEFFVALVRRRA